MNRIEECKQLIEIKEKIAAEVEEWCRKHFFGRPSTQRSLEEFILFVETMMNMRFAIDGYRWAAINPHFEDTALVIDGFKLVEA